jgi:LDH2 family malate/lactate/ureidoglycolate dehydrogenase
MLTFRAPELRRQVVEIFRAAAAPEAVAQRVAESLVESNLVGHDSHGVLRVPEYVKAIQAGTLKLNGTVQVIQETAATALLDCGWNLGQVAVPHGMVLAMSKARAQGVGVVVLRHCDHTGRIGEYALMAAQQEMLGQVICNGSLPGGIVAPFGGSRRALGANPLAWAIPGAGEQPIFLDFATSAVAHGKLQVPADKGELVPEGWILDKTGQPTRNPLDQFDDGAILPFGGHKGYALSVMIELLAGGLSGVGFPLMPDYRWDQGTMLVAVNIAAFQPVEEFKRMVAAFTERLKATPRAQGFEEILLPGEPEWRCKAARERDGIPLPDVTWRRIEEAANSLGLRLQASA